MTLEYKVINQQITSSCNNYYVVADSVNYLKLDFQFTADWQNFAKLITFRNGLTILTIALDENDSCIVPWEVIKTPAFIFSIVGSKDGIVITTNTMKVIVRASGDQDGCDPKAPTKQFWEELGGGTEGQVLIKESDADYDYTWGDLQDLSYDGEHTFKDVIDNLQETKERAYTEPNEDGEDCYTLCFTNDVEGD